MATKNLLMLPKPSIDAQLEVAARRIMGAARYWYDRRQYVEYLRQHQDEPELCARIPVAEAEVVIAEQRLESALNDEENIGMPELLAEWEAESADGNPI